MAYANAHVKVTIFGTSMGGAEIWSTGFRMGQEDSGGGNFGVNQDWLDSLLPEWATFFSGQNAYIHNNWKCDGIKAAVILPTGKTDLANVITSSYGSPIAGTAIDRPYPPQISLVAQLAAASSVGLGAKGRMYLPGVNHSMQGNGQLANADALKVATGLAAFLQSAETLSNSPGYVINASKGRVGIPFAPPVHRRVTQVRVGSVFDTQRRRRNALPETYSSKQLAA